MYLQDIYYNWNVVKCRENEYNDYLLKGINLAIGYTAIQDL